MANKLDKTMLTKQIHNRYTSPDCAGLLNKILEINQAGKISTPFETDKKKTADDGGIRRKILDEPGRQNIPCKTDSQHAAVDGIVGRDNLDAPSKRNISYATGRQKIVDEQPRRTITYETSRK